MNVPLIDYLFTFLLKNIHKFSKNSSNTTQSKNKCLHKQYFMRCIHFDVVYSPHDNFIFTRRFTWDAVKDIWCIFINEKQNITIEFEF